MERKGVVRHHGGVWFSEEGWVGKLCTAYQYSHADGDEDVFWHLNT